MKIGVRAHDYGKHSIEGLASLLREEGYDGAQLALPKVFEEIDSYEDIRLSHIERIRRAFEGMLHGPGQSRPQCKGVCG